jgi:2-keto-4-pentenoate hydratase/2-oxohepta-3-ene-1,7-dioic acid hydratase in catechol pathway
MPVNVVRYLAQGVAHWGLLKGDRIVQIETAASTTGEFVRSHSIKALEEVARVTPPTAELDQVQLLSPVTANQQFLCQGANYRQHMVESGVDPDQKTYNMIFTKSPHCMVAANSPVVKPRVVELLDYEVELGLVMKRDVLAREAVTEGNLHEFVAGIVIVNDYSARDIQIPQSQFYKGKSYRTFGPVGPYLCLLGPDEMSYLGKLDLTLTVNGVVRQCDNTGNMIWAPAETLTELSGVHDLHAGDLLATGTPAGCALSVPSPLKQRIGGFLPEARRWRLFLQIQRARTQYLKRGEVVEATIRSRDGCIDLGTQRNLVEDEA